MDDGGAVVTDDDDCDDDDDDDDDTELTVCGSAVNKRLVGGAELNSA